MPGTFPTSGPLHLLFAWTPLPPDVIIFLLLTLWGLCSDVTFLEGPACLPLLLPLACFICLLSVYVIIFLNVLSVPEGLVYWLLVLGTVPSTILDN